MLEQEAIEKIKEKACNNRCIPELCNDGCMYGNEKCAFSMAIKALEEVQQYRSIGTPEEFRAMVEKQTAMKKYCDEEGCLNCPYHNPLLKENRCMNDFIVECDDKNLGE